MTKGNGSAPKKTKESKATNYLIAADGSGRMMIKANNRGQYHAPPCYRAGMWDSSEPFSDISDSDDEVKIHEPKKSSRCTIP